MFALVITSQLAVVFVCLWGHERAASRRLLRTVSVMAARIAGQSELLSRRAEPFRGILHAPDCPTSEDAAGRA